MELKNTTPHHSHDAEALLREYVRIRHEMAGEERILALCEWANTIDQIYAVANDKLPQLHHRH